MTFEVQRHRTLHIVLADNAGTVEPVEFAIDGNTTDGASLLDCGDGMLDTVITIDGGH